MFELLSRFRFPPYLNSETNNNQINLTCMPPFPSGKLLLCANTSLVTADHFNRAKFELPSLVGAFTNIYLLASKCIQVQFPVKEGT